ncbi:MAG TPA: choice-of-anchor L domain-containing protein, partial [Bacteroidia bacterium]|nr:choice-of-anchor L domain-containing protein [Bacteroidia bacterium]
MKFVSKKYFFRTFLFIAFFSKTFSVSAQLVVDSVPTTAQIIATLQGPGVTVSNLNINCHREGYGTFTATGTSLGIASGLLLTNGFATNAIGPNNYPTIATQCWNTFSTDTNLTNIINYPPPGPSPAVKVVDACIMTFDIVPTCDS